MAQPERDFCFDNLLVRIHFIVETVWWAGLAPCVYALSFSGSLTSTVLELEATSRSLIIKLKVSSTSVHIQLEGATGSFYIQLGVPLVC